MIGDGDPVPFIVAGNGGYHNLHQLAVDPGTDTQPKHPVHPKHPAHGRHPAAHDAAATPAAKPKPVAADAATQAELQYGDDKNWGYLTLTIDKDLIHGSYTRVDKDGNVTKDADTFTTPATTRTLAAGNVSL